MPKAKKFRYYITSLTDGCIKGTDDTKTAEGFAACEDYFVADSETGEWVHTEGRSPVKAI